MDGEEAEEQGSFNPMASAGLFVGISTFEDERIPEVPFAVDDAVDLASLFALELGLVSPNRTVLLLAGEPRKPESIKRLARLVECGARRRSARQRDIYQYLGEVTRVADERGIALVTVATHGVSDLGGDFLIATDSLRERTLRTGVAVDELFDEVARAGAGRRLVLLDACRERLSQGTRGGEDAAMSQSFADAIARAKGLVILSGATLGGFAYDDRERENGVFTAAVLEGLRGGALAGSEGWITIRTLSDFVQQRVTAWVHHNRPDHITKSLGISRRIEATAEALPLAPHPDITQERKRYSARREMALERVKDNQGKVLSGALWDQVVSWLPIKNPSPEAERLLGEIEALDGTERSQRSLRDFLREFTNEMTPPLSSTKIESNQEVRRSEATMLITSREVDRPPLKPIIAQNSAKPPKPNIFDLKDLRTKFAIALMAILFMLAPTMFFQPWKQVPQVAPKQSSPQTPKPPNHPVNLYGGHVLNAGGHPQAGASVTGERLGITVLTDSYGYFNLLGPANETAAEQVSIVVAGTKVKRVLCQPNKLCEIVLP